MVPAMPIRRSYQVAVQYHQAVICSVLRVRQLNVVPSGQEDKHVVLVGGLGDGLLLAP